MKSTTKKYFDAKHNCYAYIIDEAEKQDEDLKILHYEKASDNGEPQGTAGAPILEIIKRNNLSNVIIIVTRYFGGILLGTGGLTRAYSEAAKLAVQKCETIDVSFGNIYELECEYENQKDIIYELNKSEIKIAKQEYVEKVKLQLEVPNEKENELKNIVKKLQEQNKMKIEVKKIKSNVIIGQIL